MVPTNIFIWVTPDENILGKSFSKKISYIFIDIKFKIKIKRIKLLTKKYKKIIAKSCY